MVLLIRLSLTLITNCIICYLEHGDETLHEDKAKKKSIKFGAVWVEKIKSIRPPKNCIVQTAQEHTHTHTSKTETQTQTNTSL